MRFERCKMLFGEENFAKLQQAKILILGVGGVGSYALDCLYRSGVQDITILDFDVYDESNRNRQIGSDAVGMSKVDTLANLYPGIQTIEQQMDMAWVASFDFEPYDLVIDAADTTKVKIEVAKKCYKKLIMALGSAKRFDTNKIEVTSIWKTHGDALAKKIRDELKKAKFNKNFIVVFSPEEDKCKEKGSCVAVTGAVGLTVCSEVIKRILH
ncbi:MAG TPA: ThiF family adenylyltransferase [Sulfurovum sp.]|nr:MAG: tRNA cyclic N6-threonylcarbamoyladenosine(37) synthase TcdA [Sulfurovum sp. 35-42-20]OYY56954.1 MAG: tRNA cyclic N6-threonylcarbamoyladenosine(37) synthase TcdA [Sulfurovum sp. 28-43-6]OYZ26602.1 MAG: tRNA cyclic N6-threonylcarbamoyladenosine(37) synthase TcdA [Sulfurovum sp. 16-42-52]OYZ50689.1 MAG: tRNA cyclic N6-threonylcarbamoyladenosine(37) synthase TcdA [Sulfurovum sp. 24-42-9]OZA47115.1 MAG: tRNA cyclic N6-threonylcarbamoyladenosine(37) synthase TcdA [Sulfurovum sp. 17-42-90]OZA